MRARPVLLEASNFAKSDTRGRSSFQRPLRTIGDGWHRVLRDPSLISNLSSILITLSFVNLLDDKDTEQDSTLLIYPSNSLFVTF